MAATKDKTLLPVGRELDHDGQPLKINHRLGGGLTAEVYDGSLRSLEEKESIHVAVKSMKTLEFPMARQLFLQESETLAFLMHLEEEADREQGINLKVAPRYYGRGEFEKIPFLVMEFIEGKKIIDLLRESQNEKFPEPQALVIAWHLFRTLDILHGRLRKTYIDLKFENLWWVESATEWGGQLKITDFGTIEDIQATDTQGRAVRRDLLLASTYLCKMLTGFMPDYSLGVLRKAVEPEIKNKPMSWGAARLLRRLLHFNPQQRPSSAEQVSVDLRTLVDFWFKPVEKVLDVSRKALERAEHAYEEAEKRGQPLNDEGIAYAVRARSAFDIVRFRSPDQDLANEIERVDALLKISDYLERGKALLLGRSYSLARQVLEEGIDWSDEPPVLRRWSYLAQVGEDVLATVFEPVQEKAFEAVEALNQRRWEEAASRLDSLKKSLPSKGIDYLLTECAVFAEIDHAEKASVSGQYEQAAAHYRQAASELSKLPSRYADFIRRQEIGDLENLAYDMDAHLGEINARAEAEGLITEAQEAIEKGVKDKAIELARRAIIIYRPFGFLPEALSQLIRLALTRCYYSTALQLAQICVLYGDRSDAIFSLFLLAEHFYEADKSLALDDAQDFVRHLRNVLTDYHDDVTAQSALRNLLDKAEQKAEAKQDMHLYDGIADLADFDQERANRARERSAQLMIRNVEQRHVLVDSLLAEAQYWLIGLDSSRPEMLRAALGELGKLDSPLSNLAPFAHSKQERFEKAAGMLDHASKLSKSDGYRLEDVKDCQEWLNQIKVQVEAAAGETDEPRRQFEDDLFYLNQKWRSLENLLNWMQRGWDVKADPQAQGLLQEQMCRELSDFLVQCYMALYGVKLQGGAITPESNATADFENGTNHLGALEVLIEKAQRVFDTLAPSALESALQAIDEALRVTQDEFADVEEAFAAGNLAKTSKILDRLAARGKGEEWHRYHQMVLRAQAWQAWLQANSNALASSGYDAALLRAIRAYLSYALPKVYWSEKVSAYLERLQDPARQKTKNARGAEVLLALKEWLDVSWTYRSTVSVAQAPGIAWNPETWSRKAYRLHRQRDMTALSKHVGDATIPQNVEESLARLTIEDWEKISREEEQALARDEQQKKTRRLFSRIAAGLAVIFLFGASLLWINRSAVSQAVFGTYTLTVTTSPTFTLTPSLTPSPTITPSPTNIPTPIPASVYLADPTGLYPALPIEFEKIWVIHPEEVKSQDELKKAPWEKEASSDAQEKGEVFYFTKGPVAINWAMDQPLESGFYEVFVLDTRTHSGGYGPQPYAVFLDGQSASPYRGQSNVIFNTDTPGKQKTDAWISLGVYEVQAGQKIQIQTNVQEIRGDSSFALSRLLIAKLSSRQKEMYDTLPGGRVLYALADDLQAIVLDTQTNKPLVPQYQGQPLFDPNVQVWGGSYRWLPLDSLKGISNNVTVQWSPAGRIPAGKYQLLVWIPAQHATAIGQFKLLLDGKPVEVPNPPIINQGDHGGEWWDLGIWDVPQESAVAIWFTVDASPNTSPNVGKELGIDAVVLVRVE